MATPASGTIIIETPLMIAVKNGVIEMVDKILELFPSRIKDVNDEGKNIFLLAVEYRQTEVCRFLRNQKKLGESIRQKVDKEGNNALHLAAKLGVEDDWRNPGEALAMSREIRWFEVRMFATNSSYTNEVKILKYRNMVMQCVKKFMPAGLLERYNKNMETPDDIFRDTHKDLMRSDGEWVAKTSQSCSVVSTLVASVAFATRDTVPGGYDTSNGYAILRNNRIFMCFAISSYLALLFSLMSTICFLSIVASRSQSVSSWKYLPFKLYLGMYFMFFSIPSLWISFSAGFFFLVDHDSRNSSTATLCSYIFLSSIVILFLVIQLPTFIGPALSNMRLIPGPRHKTTPPIVFR